MTTETPSQRPSAPDLKTLWPRLALFVSVVGVVGSLYLSLQLDLKACPLCFYQRAFIMSVAAILGIGLFLPGVPAAALTPLALAPAVAGGGVAALHTYLVWTGVLECPVGATRVLVAPQESLIVFATLLILLAVDLFHQGRYAMQGIGAMLLGYVFYSTCIKATPEPPTPTAPYKTDMKDLDGCRKVYHEKT